MHNEDEVAANPGPGAAGQRRASDVPDALRNWQVLEIDGEATPVGTSTARPAAAPPPASVPQIQDRPDEYIVAALETRALAVEAGAPATFVLGLINNGPQVAQFQAQLEGWIDERWTSAGAVLVTLQPGDRARLLLEITPPRHPAVEAGDYQLAAVIRAVEYPGRLARLGAVLQIQPFDALAMRVAMPPGASAAWLRRTLPFAVALANQGNHAVTLHLEGADAQQRCRFAFDLPPGQGDTPGVTLRPGQAASIPAQVTVRRFPLLGWHGHTLPLQVTARSSNGPAAIAWQARAALDARPVIGPWHLAALASILVALLVGTGVLAVTAVLLARLEQVASAPTQPVAPVSAPAAAPPPIIIVNLNQPAPTSPAAANSQGTAGEPGGSPDPALPLVLPDQVTAPGSVSRPAAAQPAAMVQAPGEIPASSSAPDATGETPTYAQMFQEVAQRYDLDWRMLAAQAYVESGFDALALSNSGAMGLMQVLPGTWREWAPAAGVNDPFDAHSNVQVAAVYLDYLRTFFAGKGHTGPEWMLLAYNWGPDELNDFLAAGGTWETLPEARRQYVTEILRIAQTLP